MDIPWSNVQVFYSGNNCLWVGLVLHVLAAARQLYQWVAWRRMVSDWKGWMGKISLIVKTVSLRIKKKNWKWKGGFASSFWNFLLRCKWFQVSVCIRGKWWGQQHRHKSSAWDNWGASSSQTNWWVLGHCLGSQHAQQRSRIEWRIQEGFPWSDPKLFFGCFDILF